MGSNKCTETFLRALISLKRFEIKVLFVQWHLSWETTVMRDHLSWKTTYSCQKVIHFNMCFKKVQWNLGLGTPKGLYKTVLNSEVVLFVRSISMYWIDLGTEVVVLNSQVVHISQVVVKTGFTVIEPVTKDHLLWHHIYMAMGWSFKTGFNCHSATMAFYRCNGP